MTVQPSTDPFGLLDPPRPPTGTRALVDWAQTQLATAQLGRQIRDDALAEAEQLDPTDHSLTAREIREAAAELQAQGQHRARQVEWAAAALRTDPQLAERLNPAITQDAITRLAHQANDVSDTDLDAAAEGWGLVRRLADVAATWEAAEDDADQDDAADW